MKHALALVIIAVFLSATSAFAADVSKPGNQIKIIETQTSTGHGIPQNGEKSEYGIAPKVKFTLPSTLVSNRDNRGKMSWDDPDDGVIYAYLTVFYHDGDVQTVALFDDNIPASKGQVTFTISPRGYNPPLGSNGFAFVTVTDQQWNITQMSTSFLVR